MVFGCRTTIAIFFVCRACPPPPPTARHSRPAAICRRACPANCCFPARPISSLSASLAISKAHLQPIFRIQNIYVSTYTTQCICPFLWNLYFSRYLILGNLYFALILLTGSNNQFRDYEFWIFLIFFKRPITNKQTGLVKLKIRIWIHNFEISCWIWRKYLVWKNELYSKSTINPYLFLRNTLWYILQYKLKIVLIT